jgi:hypothetical protein
VVLVVKVGSEYWEGRVCVVVGTGQGVFYVRSWPPEHAHPQAVCERWLTKRMPGSPNAVLRGLIETSGVPRHSIHASKPQGSIMGGAMLRYHPRYYGQGSSCYVRQLSITAFFDVRRPRHLSTLAASVPRRK